MWNFLQSKIATATFAATKSVGTNYAVFDNAANEGNLIFIVTAADGGSHCPMPLTDEGWVADSLDTKYTKFWTSSGASTKQYPNVTIWVGKPYQTGYCTVFVNYQWSGSYYQYPPFHSTMLILEYSGVEHFEFFKVLDSNSGALNSLYTGETDGVSADNYTTKRDTIEIAYAVNTATATLDYRANIQPGMGKYSENMSSVGPPGTAGPDTLPYFSDIVIFGEYDSITLPSGRVQGANTMVYSF